MTPGGNWTLKTSLYLSSNSTELGQSFSTTHLAVRVTCKDCKDSWHKAGYLYQFVDVPLIGKAEFRPRFFINLNQLTIIRLNPVSPAYRLRFEKASWIDSLKIDIYQPSMSVEGN